MAPKKKAPMRPESTEATRLAKVETSLLILQARFSELYAEVGLTRSCIARGETDVARVGLKGLESAIGGLHQVLTAPDVTGKLFERLGLGLNDKKVAP